MQLPPYLQQQAAMLEQVEAQQHQPQQHQPQQQTPQQQGMPGGNGYAPVQPQSVPGNTANNGSWPDFMSQPQSPQPPNLPQQAVMSPGTQPEQPHQPPPPASAPAPQSPPVTPVDINALTRRITETQQQLGQMGNMRNELQESIQRENSALRQQLQQVQETINRQNQERLQAETQAIRSRLGENLNPETMADLDAYLNSRMGAQAHAQTQSQPQYEEEINRLRQQVESMQQQSQQFQQQSQASSARNYLLRDHPDLDQYLRGANNAEWEGWLEQPVAQGSHLTRQALLDTASESGNLAEVSRMLTEYKQSRQQQPQQQPSHYQQQFSQSPDPNLQYQQVNPMPQHSVSPYVTPNNGQMAPAPNGGFHNQQYPANAQQYTAADLHQASQDVAKFSSPGTDPGIRQQAIQRYNEIDKYFSQQAGNQSLLPPIH